MTSNPHTCMPEERKRLRKRRRERERKREREMTFFLKCKRISTCCRLLLLGGGGGEEEKKREGENHVLPFFRTARAARACAHVVGSLAAAAPDCFETEQGWEPAVQCRTASMYTCCSCRSKPLSALLLPFLPLAFSGSVVT